MVKKTWFLLVGCCFCISQGYTPFPKDSAAWMVDERYFCMDVDCPRVNNYTFYMNGKTQINSKTYTKFYASVSHKNEVISENLHFGYFREDSLKRVYFLNKGCDPASGTCDEVLLYNFNIKIGDTVTVNRATTITGDSITLVVLDTGSVIFSNKSYKKFKLLYPKGKFPNEYEWIEGVGNAKGPSYHSYENDVDISQRLVDFQIGLDVLEIENLDQDNRTLDFLYVNSHPNPFSHRTRITIKGENWARLAIFDVVGRKVHEWKRYPYGGVYWAPKKKARGVYVLKASSAKGSVSQIIWKK